MTMQGVDEVVHDVRDGQGFQSWPNLRGKTASSVVCLDPRSVFLGA
jgi:hypothetical protein